MSVWLMSRGRVAALLIALAAAPALRAQASTAPQEPPAAASAEAAAFEALDWELQDLGRGREVPVRLYWPRAGAPDARLPLVVFSHGLGGSRQGYSYLGQYWASQGIAALHVQHVGSDRRVWRGNPLSLVSRLQEAAQAAEAEARVLDIRFALDQLLAGERGSRIDPERIAVAGHSYGANTSLLLAGARVPRIGQPGGDLAPLRDPRIKAAILISAPPFHGQGDASAIVGAIRIPTLHITATEDVIRVPGFYSDTADRVALFEATGSASKELVVFAGGSHSIFTDRAGTGGLLLNPRVKAATRELTHAFLARVFEGREDGWRRWLERHAELVARSGPSS